jgi:hypothetical protein
MHFPIFSLDLTGVHLWRQSHTQINIQNFYRHDNNILHTRVNTFNGDNIRRLEFPIMQWLIANIQRIFGESITVTRSCIFLIGLFSVLGMYRLTNLLFKDKTVGLLTAWFFNFAPVFYYYTMNPIPDNFALCCSIWFMVYFYKSNPIASGIFLCLAALAKLPYILFGAIVPVYLLLDWLKGDNKNLVKHLLTYSILILPALAWYVWVIPQWHVIGVEKGIFGSKITLHKVLEILDYWKTMFPKLIINLAAIPLFLMCIWGIFTQKVLKKPNFIAFAVAGSLIVLYFLYEINIIDVVHDYYLMPFLPIVFVMVGYGIHLLLKLKKWGLPLAIATAFLMPITAYQATHHYWSDDYIPEHKDASAFRKELRAAVPSDEKCIIINDVSTFVFSYLIDKQGFCFWDDNLPAGWIDDMITNKNVHYMYSNTRKVDERPEVKAFIDSLVMEKGIVRVFKLKKK